MIFETIDNSSPPQAGSADQTVALSRIGCVSFLNSKPLLYGLPARSDLDLHLAVPSALLGLIEQNQVATALMSVVDYQTSKTNLLLVPSGMIGCDGPTLTVRLFSRVPFENIRILHADTDSHTSVILAQLILRERFRLAPPVQELHAQEGVHPDGRGWPETMLLIGDKVVNAAPTDTDYPYQLDLGQAWKELTGLPFVFAMWMMREDAFQQDRPGAQSLARLLRQARERGAQHTDDLLDQYAAEKQWPRDLARRYFTEYLRYEVTSRAREGLAQFFDMAHRAGLLSLSRDICYLEPAP